MKTIRILLVDDQSNIRRGLRMRLGIESDMEVVGEAADGAQAIDVAQEVAADVVLMDVEMPVMDGVTATDRLRTLTPETAVIMLSLHDDAVTRARANAAGAVEFVAKHRMDETLLGAIRGPLLTAHPAPALSLPSAPCYIAERPTPY